MEPGQAELTERSLSDVGPSGYPRDSVTTRLILPIPGGQRPLRVTLDTLDVNGDEYDATITAEVDGTFDRAGLPDPLVMTFRIVVVNGKITKLTCPLMIG